MNFFKILVFLYLWASVLNIAQNKEYSGNSDRYFGLGLPQQRYYASEEYGGDAQNWAIVQDSLGKLYFGNNAGVLEYDGVNWRLIQTPTGLVRALAIDKENRIFVGGINDLGFLSPDRSGTLQFVSLKKYIPKEESSFGDIWTVWTTDKGIYFQSFSHIFYFIPQKGGNRNSKQPEYDVKLWKAATRFEPAFLVSDKLLFLQKEIGLFQLLDGVISKISGGDFFALDKIYSILPYKPQKNNSNYPEFLIGTEKLGFYLYDGLEFKKFQTSDDEFFLKNKLYLRGAVIDDSMYAFGTQAGGVAIMDRNGSIRKIVNKGYGLKYETVLFVFPDRDGNLWLALNGGIQKIALASPLSILNEDMGLNGIIIDIHKHNGILYVATMKGVYYLSGNQSKIDINLFKPVPGLVTQSWALLSYEGMLLAGTNTGIFKIVNNKAELITPEIRQVYSLCRSKVLPGIVYVGCHNGFGILKYDNGKWNNLGFNSNIKTICEQIIEDSNGDIWISTPTEGIYRVELQKDFKSPENAKIEKYDEAKGVTPYQNFLLFADRKVRVGTQQGMVVYDKTQDHFVADASFGNEFMDNSFRIKTIDIDDHNTIWMIGGKNEAQSLINVIPIENHQFKIRKYYLPLPSVHQNSKFSSFIISAASIDQKTILVGDQARLISYSLDKVEKVNPDLKYYTLIRNVVIRGDSVIYGGADVLKSGRSSNETVEISPTNNSIRFEYAAPYYVEGSGILYQYFLEGFDNNWSSWTTENKKDYTNLSNGTFLFRVRAKNIFGKISEEAVFKFTILTPWYKTFWAMTLYFLLLAFLIYALLKVRLRYLENKNLELDNIIKLRTAEILRQKEMIEEQSKRLVELDRMKSHFFANISHELRTPLTLIMGHIKTALTGIQNESIVRKLSIAYNNSRKQLHLINQLLDLSKIESGKMKLRASYADIVPVLRRIYAAFESLAEQKQIVYKFISNEASIYLFFDQERISGIMENLLANAFKFTSEDGRITVEVSQITTDQKMKISIRDTGIGISPENLSNIFDRYYQADDSATKEYEGTGIGLSIVKESVQLHHGQITVKSEIGEGTEFNIFIPMDKSSYYSEEIIGENAREELTTDELPDEEILITTDSTGVDNNTSVKIQNSVPQKEIILIVEDNKEMLEFIIENLDEGFSKVSASDGEEGVAVAFDVIPDVIITDVMMPKMNGYDLCRTIKNDQRTSHIPIIMLTAKAQEDSKIQGLEIGVDDYLIKPFSPTELNIRVKNLIKLRKMLREKFSKTAYFRPEEVTSVSLDQQFLEKIISIIKENISDENFSVEKLADLSAISLSHLHRKLNALIGQPAGQLIRVIRLEKAAELIRKGDIPIKEIAFQVGFGQQSSFSTAFKKHFGVSPNQYTGA